MKNLVNQRRAIQEVMKNHDDEKAYHNTGKMGIENSFVFVIAPGKDEEQYQERKSM